MTQPQQQPAKLPRRHFRAVPADELRVLAIIRESEKPIAWSEIAQIIHGSTAIEYVRGVRDACRALEEAELVTPTSRRSLRFVPVRTQEPIGPEDWWRRIAVPDHVRRRVIERLAWDGTHREIVVEVRLDLICGRVSSIRPNWTRGAEQRPNGEDRAAYVWDDTASRCWVVIRDGNRLAVMTLLTSSDEHAERGADRLLRTGLRR